MLRRTLACLALILALAGSSILDANALDAPPPAQGAPAPDADGFVPIFDGKTLDGWKAPDIPSGVLKTAPSPAK